MRMRGMREKVRNDREQKKLAVSFAYGLNHAIERVLRDRPDEVFAFKKGDMGAFAAISGDVNCDLVSNGFVGPFEAVRDRVWSVMTRRYLMN